MTNKSKYFITIMFLAFIGVFAILFWVVPKSDFSPKEKRYLQTFPEVSATTLTDGSFETKFEDYINDHMVMRDAFMGINSYSNLLVLNNGSDGVYKCKNGYLINKPATNERLDLNLSVVSDFQKKTGIDTSLMIVPSTGYIMDNVLPHIHEKYNDDEYFKTINKYCSENNLSNIDLRTTFKANKDNTQIYYKTDHHWTTKGAYTGYQELCKALGITPIDDSTLKKDSYPDFYGTTYSSSGFWLTPPDNIEIWNNPKNSDRNIFVKITEGANIKTSGSMYFTDHLKEDDKYPVFIDGNHALTEITNTNAKNGTILLIKDSFSHSLAPFLAENYSKVVLVDLRYYKESVSDLVSAYNPEQVVVLYGIDNLATDTDIVWLK